MDKNQESDSMKEIDRIEAENGESEKRKSGTSQGGQSIENTIVKLALENGAALFHDQFKEPHAIIGGDERQIHKIRSKVFRRWISHLAWKELGKAIKTEVMSSVLQILESQAVFDAEEYELHVRVAKHDDAIWYDIGDGSVVRITSEGWDIVEHAPILFRRLNHQRRQVRPQRGGDLGDLLPFLNVAGENEKLLLLVYLVVGLMPGFPHPILITYGPQGSAKTTLARIVKALLDPSEIDTATVHSNVREFVQFASHHWVFFLDNLSDLSDWLSDALARACTGDGLSKRELFSDDDDIIYRFQRVIGINGINLVAEKPDLLDRSLLVALERIPETARQREESFWETFREKQPYLLGAVFDAVSGAMRGKKNIDLPTLPRMADFTLWGCAAAEALGYPQAQFLSAYAENRRKQHDEAIEANLIGTVVVKFMEERIDDLWEGSPTETLEELTAKAVEMKIDVKARAWPHSAVTLWKRINEIRSNLDAKGISAERGKDKARFIILRRMVKTDAGSVGDAEAGDSADNSDTSEQAEPSP